MFYIRCPAPFPDNTDSKSRRYLCWLVFLLLNVLICSLRRLNPRRLDFILDLKSELALQRLVRHVARSAVQASRIQDNI
jgi:hypothetical protein